MVPTFTWGLLRSNLSAIWRRDVARMLGVPGNFDMDWILNEAEKQPLRTLRISGLYEEQEEYNRGFKYTQGLDRDRLLIENTALLRGEGVRRMLWREGSGRESIVYSGGPSSAARWSAFVSGVRGGLARDDST